MGNILKLNKSVSQAERGGDMSCNYPNSLTGSQARHSQHTVNIRYHTRGLRTAHISLVHHGNTARDAGYLKSPLDIWSHYLISGVTTWYLESPPDIWSHHLISGVTTWYLELPLDIWSHQLISEVTTWYLESPLDIWSHYLISGVTTWYLRPRLSIQPSLQDKCIWS